MHVCTFHDGNVFVVGSFAVGVVVLVPSGCLCIENAVFGCNEMIAVQVEILVSVCWFSVYCGD